MKPIAISTFQPRLRVLGREQAWAVHAAALEILERTGCKMEHRGALEMLADAGCRVSGGDWVKIPPYIVEEALRSAPRQITLYDQRGNRARPLSTETLSTVQAPMLPSLWIWKPVSGDGQFSRTPLISPGS